MNYQNKMFQFVLQSVVGLDTKFTMMYNEYKFV